MDATELGALLMMGFVGSFTPGPNNTLSTAIGANHGFRAALPFIWAVPVGWCALLLLASLGFGALVLAVPPVRWALLVFGVGYMLWLAWRLAGSGSLAKGESAQARVGFWQGVLLQVVNVKGWMMAVSVAAGWVAGHPDVLVRTLIVLVVLFPMGFLSNAAYALVGSMLRVWLSVGRRLVWFNRVMALALALTALWMVQQGSLAFRT